MRQRLEGSIVVSHLAFSDVNKTGDGGQQMPAGERPDRGRASSIWRGRLEVVALMVFIALGVVMIWRFALKEAPGAVAVARDARQTSRIKPSPPPEPRLPSEPVSIAGAILKGSPTAPVVIVEYSEFECPFCASFVRTTFGDLDREYIATGRVVFAFRHLPLETIHRHALKAAEASECANRQRRFWEFHDALFENPKEIDEISLVRRAGELRLDLAAFKRCLTGEGADKVRQDMREAGRLGVRGTPTFFIGTNGPDNLVRVTDRIAGARPVSDFRQAIEKALGTVTAETR